MLICLGLLLLGFAVAGVLYIGHEAKHMTPLLLSRINVLLPVFTAQSGSSPQT